MKLYKNVEGSAIFDSTEQYRYSLKRTWEKGDNLCNFIMLNPSTATKSTDDRTIHKCQVFAGNWGYNGIIVTNLFALRSSDPRLLYKAMEPVGSSNDDYIQLAAKESNLIICAWGNHGLFRKRGDKIRQLLSSYDKKCFDITKLGQPKHPLYVLLNEELKPYA